MIDLNKHFIAFAKGMTAANGKYSADDDKVLDKLLFAWKATPSDSLDGKTPLAYVNGLTANQLIESLKHGENSLIFDKIRQTCECAPLLIDLIQQISRQTIISNEKNRLLQAIFSLIAAFDTPEPLSAYVKLLKSDISSDVKELIIDRLKLNADSARPFLLNKIEDEGLEYRTIAGEILCEGQKCEQTFKLLVALFLQGDNIPLYAGYLGKYGDERAAGYLYPALDNADYVDFVEIKNAIERLGGLVDDNMRDFTHDPLYQLVKASGKKQD